MYDADCTRCPLHLNANLRCIPGTGNPNADIVLYGEAPGATEDRGGEPFIGDAGKLLDEALQRAGLSRDDIYISNVVRCRPPENRTPYAPEIAACRTYTAQELVSIQPKVVVTLGGTPLKALTKQTAVGRSRGTTHRMIPDYRSEVPVIATYHPAAALHNPGERERILSDLVSDLRTAKSLAAGEQDSGVEITLPKAEVFQRLSQCELLACDLEWESWEDAQWPWSRRAGRTPQLVSIAVSGRVDGALVSMVAPWPTLSESQRGAFRALLRNVPTVYHFGTSDVVWLLSEGFDPIIGGDTHLLASLLNVNTSLSLESLVSTFTDFPAWKAEGDLVKGKMPRNQEEWASLLRYNAKDAAATLLLHEELLAYCRGMGRERVLTLYYRVLCPAIKTLSKIAITGARLDMQELEAWGKSLLSDVQSIESRIAAMVGMPGRVGVVRGDSLAPLVEKLLQIQLPRTEKTNKPSLARDILETLRGKHEIVDLLIERSEIRKQLSTYFIPYLKMLREQGDERLHTVYKLTTARTGRSSAMIDMGGTLQQYPRGEMRRLVIPRDGWRLVVADESQIELRIGASIANERTMIRWYNEDPKSDLHKLTGGWLKASKNGLTLQEFMAEPSVYVDTITYEERTGAKVPNFGFLYGGHEQVVIDAAQRDYGISLSWEEARAMREGYFSLYGDLTRWHETAGPRDVARGYCESPLGRRRYADTMPDEDYAGMIRKMVNTPVQVLASDLALAATVKADQAIEREGLRAYLIGFVHDSMMAEVHPDDEARLCEIIKEAMENPMLEELGLVLPVPLKADVAVGPNWRDAS